MVRIHFLHFKIIQLLFSFLFPVALTGGFRHLADPFGICNCLTFSHFRQLADETSASFIGSLLTTTMASPPAKA
jgi:hypothetical protein